MITDGLRSDKRVGLSFGPSTGCLMNIFESQPSGFLYKQLRYCLIEKQLLDPVAAQQINRLHFIVTTAIFKLFLD